MSSQDVALEQVEVTSRANFVAKSRAIIEAAEERARQRQHPHGRRTARERVKELLDEGSFTELNRFAGGDMDKGELGSAVITGVGTIDGRQVAVYSQDFSIMGGTLGQVEGDKILHIMDSAMNLRIPIIGILDSGGARIQEGVMALAQYGRIFKKATECSGVVPQISIILGPCAGGAVYGPALTDFIIMTKKSSYMFVTGPTVVKAATGEDIAAEDLGGGDLHNTISGVAHFLAEDEDEALDYAKTLLSYLPSHCQEAPPLFHFDPATDTPPEAANVGDLVPESPKQAYDMVEVIQTLADNEEFLEVQPLFAPSILIGFASFEGRPAGIVANQPLNDAGTLDVDASEKAARFVQFCDAFGIPIVTLVDVPGYRPGSEQERAGIIRRGAKLITAYATASVPLVTVIIRKAYGGAYIVMGSKSLGADVNYSWPASQIAVMGSEGAVDIVFRRQLAKAGQEGRNVAEQRAHYQAMYEKQSVNPNLSLRGGQLDGLIEPSRTREAIARSLHALATKDRSVHSPRVHDNAPM
ncbi:acyl-CoA carboxylase subunit beta [Schaalia sp. 19OD2882]|uniref:acyl-CoA carboxylase subunit beta n=1 Tax=Schaalia sp. 19OD2882 TaxID=2794089 RepID=UPI001C1ED50C|nr:acyl-CoA carboxylase subunit beta [Schaalia sp. 19OD2882]QWW19411.1 acyl-CoA carboxylase subunit beta [Schaalia sp. 19OD2882]